MIGKLVMFGCLVLGLRWLAAGAPVSERTVAMDAHDGARQSAQRHASDRDVPPSAQRTQPRIHADDHASDREPLVSNANQERIKEISGEVWTLARPVLRVAAEHALNGLASLLRTAADNLPRKLGDGDDAPQPQQPRHSN